MTAKTFICFLAYMTFMLTLLSVEPGHADFSDWVRARPDPEIPPMPDVEVPVSAESIVLADSVFENAEKLAYNCRKFPDFESEYTIHLAPGETTPMRVNWTLSGGDGDLAVMTRTGAGDVAAELRDRCTKLFNEYVLHSCMQARSIGMKWHDMYLVHTKSPAGWERFLFSKEYQLLRKVREYRPDIDFAFKSEKIDGLYRINEILSEGTQGGEDCTYKLYYKDHSGYPVIEKIEITDPSISPGRNKPYIIELETVWFITRTAIADEGPQNDSTTDTDTDQGGDHTVTNTRPSVSREEERRNRPVSQEEEEIDQLVSAEEEEEDAFDDFDEDGISDTPRWDKLSRQIIPRIIKNNEDMASMMRKIRRTRCVINARITNRMNNMTGTGRLSYSWQDKNQDGVLVGDEVEVEIEETSDLAVGMQLRKFRGDIKLLTLCNVFNIFQIHHVKTKKVKAGYLMTLKPIMDATADKWVPFSVAELKVTNDYRIVEMKAKGSEDARSVVRWKHTNVGGKWLPRGFVSETSVAGMGKTVSNRTETYKVKNGIAFLTKITLTERMPMMLGAIEMDQEYRFVDWKVKRRNEKLAIPGTGNQQARLNE